MNNIHAEGRIRANLDDTAVLVQRILSAFAEPTPKMGWFARQQQSAVNPLLGMLIGRNA